MNPVLFEIGPLTIRWYGVMIAAACILGVWLAGKEAERKGLDKKNIQDFSLYAVIGAIIGARLYNKVKKDGYLFFLYVMLYSIIRIFVEHFRADKLTCLSHISAAQSIGILGIVLSISFMLYIKGRKTFG